MGIEALRIGLIGVGHRARMAENFEVDGRARVVAGADINDAFIREFRAKYAHNDPFVTRDYRELLERQDIDAVGVYTPDNLHCEPTIAALAAGKHVFCEKPMAIHTERCDAMLQAARKANRRLVVGMNMRYMECFLALKQVMESGEIGAVKAIWVRHMVGYGGRAFFHDYRARRDGSNSLLLQKAAHDIDMIHFLSGRYTQRVTAMGSLDYYGGAKPNDLRCEHCDQQETCPEFSTRDLEVRDEDTLPKTMCAFRNEIDVEDHNMVLMDLGDMRASYLQCHYTAQTDRNYLAIGTKGQAELSGNTITLTTQKANGAKARADALFATATIDVGRTPGGHGGADPRLCKDVLDFFVDGKQPVTSAEAGRMAVAAGCAAIDSLRNENTPVNISPCP